MMQGIRRLVVCTAVSGLLAAGAVTASMGVARADNFAAACGGNSANGYICNLDTTVASPGSMTVNVDSGAASEGVNMYWTVTCADSTDSQNDEGATLNAATPVNVPLAPLPPTAADGNCNVNVGISLPTHDHQAEDRLHRNADLHAGRLDVECSCGAPGRGFWREVRG